MFNPLFALITLNLNHFKKSFKVTSRKNQEGKFFYIIEPTLIEQGNTKYLINDIEYVVENYHITIHKDAVPAEESTETSYHLTINLKLSKADGKAVLHVHFDKNNQLVFSTFRDAQQNLIAINAKTKVTQLVKGLVEGFCQTVWDIYANINLEHRERHELILAQLTEISKGLTRNEDIKLKLERYQKYKQTLQRLINQLNEWFRVNLQPENHMLPYFNNLMANVDAIINEITAKIDSSSVEQIEHGVVKVSDDAGDKFEITDEKTKVALNKKLNIKQKLLEIDSKLSKLKSDSNLLAWNKTSTEYKLLLEKFELLDDDNLALDCVLKSKDLEKMAYHQLQHLMISKNDFKKLTAHDCDQLVRIIPFLNFKDLLSAVQNNLPLMIRSILHNHTYINVNQLISGKQITLLEFAFQKRFKEAFNGLLSAGAYCDRYLSSGKTLLIKACENGYAEEMVALLKAGASPSKTNPEGFNAFGCLTMLENKIPDLNIIKLFLDNCYSFDINWYQGPMQYGQTPLSFACQKDFHELVKLLLEHSADPRIARETDFQTPLAVCAYKGFSMSVQMILQHTKFTLSAGNLNQAIKAAERYGHSNIVKMIKEYAVQHNIDLKDDEVSYTIGPGSDIFTILKAAGLSSTPSILSALDSPKAIVPLVEKKGTCNNNEVETGHEKQVIANKGMLSSDDKTIAKMIESEPKEFNDTSKSSIFRNN